MRELSAVCADIDAEQPVTAEEAEAVVRAIEKTCMGPYKGMSQRTFRGLLRRFVDDTAFTDEERSQAIQVTQAAATQGADAAAIVAALRDDGQMKATNLANALLRAGCGQDVNDLILAGPLDGDVHRIPCPQCGREMSYRAPFIQINC